MKIQRILWVPAWVLFAVAPLVTAQQPLAVDTHNLQEVVDFYFDVYQASEGHSTGWTGNLTTCNAGDISPAMREATLLRINYFRAMAGLPANVTLDPALDNIAQQTSLVLSKNDYLSHSLPSGLACYSGLAANGASHSNITLNAVGPDAVNLFIDDPGFVNTAVGHRRWLLYPGQQTMGIGAVPEKGANNPASTTIYVLGEHNDYSKPVAWPPAGYVPFQVVYYRWSYSHRGANFNNTKIYVTKDGVTKQYNKLGVVNGYGDNTVVWSPSTTFPPPPIETYTVRLENVVINGVAQTITYDVTRINPYQVEIPETPAPETIAEDYSIDFTLGAGQVSTPSTSEATGCATAYVSPANNTLSLLIDHGVLNPSNFVLGRGDAGAAGTLLAQSASVGDPIDLTFTLSDNDLNDLEAGLLYVLIQSDEHPAGAIRGQLVNNGGGECAVVYEEAAEASDPTETGEDDVVTTEDAEDGEAVVPVEGRLLWDGETPFNSSNGSPNTVDVYAGNTAFEAIPTPWHAPSIQLVGLDSFRANITNYDEIRFYAKADMPGRTFEFSVSSWPSQSHALNIAGYIDGGKLDAQWRLVRIPLADLDNGLGALTRIDTLRFGTANPTSGHHIFIDEVWAVSLDSETEGPAPEDSPAPEEEPGTGIQEPAHGEALTLFDAEGVFTSAYGATALGEAVEGSASFKGVPTTWHKPTVLLVGLPSYRADISQFDELWLYARSDQSGKTFELTLQGWPNKSTAVRVTDYIAGGVLDTEWRLVRIPLSALKTPTFGLNAIDTINLGVALPSAGHHVFIDDVRAVKLTN